MANPVLKSLTTAALFAASASPAQITSIRTDNPTLVKGDPDRIVCQKEEKIGTRLGATKVCLTVREWQENAANYREQTSRMQSQACVPLGGCGGPTIGDPH